MAHYSNPAPSAYVQLVQTFDRPQDDLLNGWHVRAKPSPLSSSVDLSTIQPAGVSLSAFQPNDFGLFPPTLGERFRGITQILTSDELAEGLTERRRRKNGEYFSTQVARDSLNGPGLQPLPPVKIKPVPQGSFLDTSSGAVVYFYQEPSPREQNRKLRNRCHDLEEENAVLRENVRLAKRVRNLEAENRSLRVELRQISGLVPTLSGCSWLQ